MVCIMGQNCQKYIGMCLDSVKDADDIVYCDGGSDEDFWSYFVSITQDKKIQVINNNYDQEDKQMNGKQRNFYLKYLKENYPNHWALCLDADEVVENLEKIKEAIQIAKPGLYSVKMRHLIGDLAHEDATEQEHYVLNRLFKISKADKYPLVEHPVLQPKEGEFQFKFRATTIWHLAYCPNMWDIKKRYENHLKKSNMHTPEYLNAWYYNHLFGTYPKKEFNPLELPKQITDEFNINRDVLYFSERKLEHKHWIDAVHWKQFFNTEGKTVAEIGCGRGPRVYAMNQVGINCDGYEINEYAIKNSMGNVEHGDITNKNWFPGKYDLVIAYDLLEHISYENLNHAIKKLIEISSKYLLISVPTLGDPNLEADPTHIIKESKDWWINQFTLKGLKQVEVPDYFLFREQLIIFER